MNNESLSAGPNNGQGDGRDTRKPAPATLHLPVDVRNFSLALLTVLAVVFVLNWASAIFIPLILGVMISYALAPFVNRMHKWRIPSAIGAAVLLLGLLGGAGVLVYSLSDDASKLIETLPAATQKLHLASLKDRGTSGGTMESMQKTASQLEQVAKEAGAPAPDIPRGVTRVQLEKPKLNIKDYLWMGTKGAVAFAGQLLMVLFLAYFMLASGDTFRRKLVKIAGPTLGRKKITLRVLDKVVVFVSVLVWGWLWGVWGLLLGVPIMMIIKAVCDHVEDLQPIGELLGD